MDTVEFSRYIPVGCLVLNQKDSKIPDQLWHLPDLNHWHHFSTANGQHSANNDPASPPLPVNIQDLLLASDALAPYANLLLHQWIQLAFSVCLDEPAQGIVRVYLLPDDIGNRAVSRQNNSLRKARLDLLGRLDLSNSTWHGEAGPNPSANPSSLSSAEEAVDDGTDKEETLLEMFNNIPSPNPRPDTVEDPYTRDAMENLLESDVPGLSTTLFPYQRRSAALMLQREEQMQKVMDPRLLKSVDREGKEWYYDAYAGVALREPRYYDEPRGGILAEEMGAGKTLISLALILATKHIPAAIPDIYRGPLVRAKVASLADMAAACITRNGVPWKSEFAHDEFPFSNCIEVIRRNPGCYAIPRPQERRALRNEAAKVSSLKIYLSHASLIIVPPNLVQQWQQEITKHTNGLKVLVVVENRQLPPVEQLLELDIILFSSTRFERFLVDPFRIERYRQGGSTWVSESPLLQIHFKRCIVDEGHRLGNSTTSNKSNLHLLIDALQITARWIVTGTPSKGLYGIDNTGVSDGDRNARLTAESSGDLEKDDLKRIGSIAAHYLKMRPWANTHAESGDTPAEWSAYVMQPKHSRESHGRKDCLKKTLESLIIRHPLSEMSKFLPTVDEKLVYLEGSYFDSLVLNIFSMNIIFNSVQSQRTDQDYFFHPKSRKALMQLVSNLRQASFFGGVFYRPTDILQSVNRAVDFLAKGKVQISPEDDALLRNAIEFGQVVLANSLKECSNLFQDIPLYVAGFPWGAGQVWSLNLQGDREIVTTSRLMHALQKLLQPIVDAPESLELLFQSGSFEAHGEDERSSCLEAQTSITGSGSSKTKVNKLAGDTRPGQDDASQSKRRTAILKMPFHMRENASAAPDKTPETKIAEPLSAAMLIATASAKLSYLIDQIVKYQGEEQIIVFYENDNVAYYLAEALEMVSFASVPDQSRNFKY